MKKAIVLMLLAVGFLSAENVIIKKKYLTINYNCDKKITNYVSYNVKREYIEKKNLKRPYKFYIDEEVTKKCHMVVKSDDFKNKLKYDRGHLASNSIFNFSKESQKETFYVSNIAPQNSRFNRVLWKRVEGDEIALVRIFGKIRTITGVCGEKGKLPSGVTIPYFFYKIIFFNGRRILIYGENKANSKIQYITRGLYISNWVRKNCDYKIDLRAYTADSVKLFQTQGMKTYR